MKKITKKGFASIIMATAITVLAFAGCGKSNYRNDVSSSEPPSSAEQDYLAITSQEESSKIEIVETSVEETSELISSQIESSSEESSKIEESLSEEEIQAIISKLPNMTKNDFGPHYKSTQHPTICYGRALINGDRREFKYGDILRIVGIFDNYFVVYENPSYPQLFKLEHVKILPLDFKPQETDTVFGDDID